jgi:hypothetical protein
LEDCFRACADKDGQLVQLNEGLAGMIAPWLHKDEFTVTKVDYYGFWSALLLH